MKVVKTVAISLTLLINCFNLFAQVQIEPKKSAQQTPPETHNNAKVPYIYPDPAETESQRATRIAWWHQA